MVQIKVPATTANLGPGFDVLGLALELFDEYTFTEVESGFHYRLVGADASQYGISSEETNLVYRAFCRFFQFMGQAVPGVEVTCKSAVPICRGLGSSAAAVVAGLVGANMLMNNPLKLAELLPLATELEGHPDNVAPALFGGLVISLMDERGSIHQQRYVLEEKDLACVLAVPDFTLETKLARGVLPKEVAFKDALFNLGRVAMLVASLTRGDYDMLREGMEDRLHQPYRATLIPGFAQAKEQGYAAGAYGIAISGAGPTILAFAAQENAAAVGEALVAGFNAAGITARYLNLQVNNRPLY